MSTYELTKKHHKPLQNGNHHTRRYAGYQMLDFEQYCPLCRATYQVCVVNWMGDWQRCSNCLLKLPASQETLKLLGYSTKPKPLPNGQRTFDL